MIKIDNIFFKLIDIYIFFRNLFSLIEFNYNIYIYPKILISILIKISYIFFAILIKIE